MKKYLKILALTLSFVLVLSACGSKEENKEGGEGENQSSETSQDNGTEEDTKEKEAAEVSDEIAAKFPTEVTNEGEVLPDGEGVLKVGLVSSSPFKGVFSSVLYSGNDDATIMESTMWGTFPGDEEQKLTKGGPAYWEFDKEAKTATLHIDEKYTWNDGTPVTARDFEYAYKIIGHADYTGPRYGDDYKNVVGMEEYRWGTTSEEKKEELRNTEGFEEPAYEGSTEVSGVEVVDDKTLKVTFKNFGVDILWGSGLPFEPVPYEQLKDIKIADLENSDAIRKNPLSCGPYYISKIVPGESLEFKANEYYWKGKAHIPTVEMKTIHPDKFVASVKAGEFDLYTGLPSSKYPDVKDLDNISILGRTDLYYSYMGFKLGKWDATLRENVTDPNAKMANLNLRKALVHAIDRQGICSSYSNDLSFPANTIIPPVFASFHASDIPTIEFDMEKAKALLDEAGYVDKDGDGFREDPNGEQFVLHMAHMSGNDVTEKIASYYLQQWNEIGIKSEYTDGRLLEFNNFYDLVGADNENIDVFFGGWGTGSNPECSGMYGRTAEWNFSRYTSEELDKLLADLSSEEAFDENFRKEAYRKVQQHMYDNLPIAVNTYAIKLVPVNKRIKHYDYSYGYEGKPYSSWADLQLLADEPIKSSN